MADTIFGKVITDVITNVTSASAISTLVAAANAGRRNIRIRNLASQLCYISTVTPALNTGWPLAISTDVIGRDEIVLVGQEAIYALPASGNLNLEVIESSYS